jgi:NADH-quinone oxidoreductase subunit N
MRLLFSLAGIPPLMGFWAKLVVFQAAVNAGLFVVAVLAVVGSVIGAFYYIKIVKVMYFDAPADTIRGPSDWVHWTLLTISSVAISPLAYLVTGWLTGLADKAAAALFLVA